MSTSTAIHSQSIVNTLLQNYIKKYLEDGIGFIYSLRVIRLDVLGLNVLVLNSCAINTEPSQINL